MNIKDEPRRDQMERVMREGEKERRREGGRGK